MDGLIHSHTVRVLWKILLVVSVALALLWGGLAGASRAHADAAVTVALQPDDLMGEYVAAVESVVNQYPTDPFVISSAVLDETHYVGAAPGKMVINRIYSTNPDLLARNFYYDVAHDFHSPGCSPQTYLGFHEAAHQIDYTHGMRARTVALNWSHTIPDSRAGELSGYSFDGLGLFSPAEALAEAFAAVKCDPAGSTPAEYDLYNILISTQ